jgi:hypothetical protein
MQCILFDGKADIIENKGKNGKRWQVLPEMGK